MEESIPLHPAIVHFAIVLPILVLIFQGLFLYTKELTYSKISFVLAIVTALFLIGAWYSGGILQDAKGSIYPLLSEHGKEELSEHANLGFILAIAMSVLAILKVLASKLQKQILEIVFLIGVVIFIGANLQQGKDGGELVYEYGAGISTEAFDAYCEDE